MEWSGDRLTATPGMRGPAPAGGSLVSYRFGIDWARIEPAPGNFSRAELAHSRRRIETATGPGFRELSNFLAMEDELPVIIFGPSPAWSERRPPEAGGLSIPFGQRGTAPRRGLQPHLTGPDSGQASGGRQHDRMQTPFIRVRGT